MRNHAAALFRFAARSCGDPIAAEDVVQETYYEAWRSLARLRDAGSGRAWLFQILRHRLARRARSIVREPRPEPGEEAVHVRALERLSRRELVQRALDTLDPAFRETFLLVMLEGVTCAEAAERLGVARGTVLSRLSRARAALRTAIERMDPEVNRDPT